MEGRLLYEGGHLFDNFVSRVSAYLREGAYSRGTRNRSITVLHLSKDNYIENSFVDDSVLKMVT